MIPMAPWIPDQLEQMDFGTFYLHFAEHFVNKMFSKMLALVALSQLCCILLCKMHFASQKVLSTVQKCIFASGQKGYSNVFLKCFDMFKNGVNNFFFLFTK